MINTDAVDLSNFDIVKLKDIDTIRIKHKGREFETVKYTTQSYGNVIIMTCVYDTLTPDIFMDLIKYFHSYNYELNNIEDRHGMALLFVKRESD